MSDEAVTKATGRDWAEWTLLLDRHGAAQLPHKEIAAWVREAHEGVSRWWAQAVTVAYERFRGLRDVGQRRDGSYEVSKSKTFPDQEAVDERRKHWGVRLSALARVLEKA